LASKHLILTQIFGLKMTLIGGHIRPSQNPAEIMIRRVREPEKMPDLMVLVTNSVTFFDLLK
jgi:hypothetical protein